METLWLRTGDPVYGTIVKRWSKVMLTLFAVGVVTGTILSFQLGPLWPGFMAAFGDVFGLGFTLEAFSFFVEAIFIAIYVYGCDRLSAGAHFLAGIPVVVAGFTGSLMVISVNAWMNNPGGFTLEGGRVTDVRPLAALFGNDYLWHGLVHMYLAAQPGALSGEASSSSGSASSSIYVHASATFRSVAIKPKPHFSRTRRDATFLLERSVRHGARRFARRSSPVVIDDLDVVPVRV